MQLKHVETILGPVSIGFPFRSLILPLVFRQEFPLTEAVHHGRDLWNFAREDTDPIHVPRPEGPWGPWPSSQRGLESREMPALQPFTKHVD